MMPVLNQDSIFSCFLSSTATSSLVIILSLHVSREWHTTSYAMVLYHFSKFRVAMHWNTMSLKGLRSITHSHLLSLESYRVR